VNHWLTMILLPASQHAWCPDCYLGCGKPLGFLDQDVCNKLDHWLGLGAGWQQWTLLNSFSNLCKLVITKPRMLPLLALHLLQNLQHAANVFTALESNKTTQAVKKKNHIDWQKEATWMLKTMKLLDHKEEIRRWMRIRRVAGLAWKRLLMRVGRWMAM